MFNFKNSFPNLNSIFKISVDDQNWQQDQGARKLQINARILRARVWTSKLLVARIPALRSFFSTPDRTQYSSRSWLSSYAGLPKITMARYNILVSLGIPSLSYCQIWWMVVLGCQWHTCLAESAGIYNPSPSISLNIDLLYESRPEIGLQPVAQGGTQ